MNYSENNKTYGRKIVKKNRRKLFVMKCCLFIIGVSFAIVMISGLMHIFGCGKTSAIPTVNAATYGTIDGKVFTEEVSLNWTSSAELDFVPLDVPMDEEIQEFIYYLSYEYNIEFPFVMALIKTESSFEVDAIGSTNDYGLMQINKINHKWLTEVVGVTDYLDPYQNVRAGTFMLRKLFEKYEDPAKVLMAYNMGETGASRLWEQGILESRYSKAVMTQAVEYKNQISERKGDSNVNKT